MGHVSTPHSPQNGDLLKFCQTARKLIEPESYSTSSTSHLTCRALSYQCVPVMRCTAYEHLICLSLDSVLHGALQVVTELRFVRSIIQLLARAGYEMLFESDINGHFNLVDLSCGGGVRCSIMFSPRSNTVGQSAGSSTTVSAREKNQRK